MPTQQERLGHVRIDGALTKRTVIDRHDDDTAQLNGTVDEGAIRSVR